jgi:hypothetical protein
MQLPDPLKVRCPACGSHRLYKDGLRYLSDESSIQRYLCRDCNYRFTEPGKASKPLKKISNWKINTSSTLTLNRQERNESRKRQAWTPQTGGLTLVTSEPQQENAQREGTAKLTDKTGKIVEFLWNLS